MKFCFYVRRADNKSKYIELLYRSNKKDITPEENQNTENENEINNETDLSLLVNSLKLKKDKCPNASITDTTASTTENNTTATSTTTNTTTIIIIIIIILINIIT